MWFTLEELEAAKAVVGPKLPILHFEVHGQELRIVTGYKYPVEGYEFEHGRGIAYMFERAGNALVMVRKSNWAV